MGSKKNIYDVYYIHSSDVSSNIPRFPSTGMISTTGKVVVDQLLFSPWLINCNFAAVQFFRNGGKFDLDLHKEKLERDFFSTVKQAWTIWPVANFIIFSIIPYNYRMGAGNLVTAYWSGYLSSMSNKTQSPPSSTTPTQQQSTITTPNNITTTTTTTTTAATVTPTSL
ncbi:pmp22 family protein [Cavenderia fasciculata]|uniref:Pmp22 family protein n=1 Tax=Cavenderia fasciculata TaxID=261658 RepID=F4Q4J7_CACFS|nr:pmp22 family protein [Cavenderia fasciculata]EGG17846.1 pmp22 family protein [Cavenderia fasciculata]|eukprot:XP_004356330.1 pmp22 family protein [Cavenderia fasciculata]